MINLASYPLLPAPPAGPRPAAIHPDFDARVLMAVDNAMRDAWSAMVRSSDPVVQAALKSGTEDDISERLVYALETIRMGLDRKRRQRRQPDEKAKTKGAFSKALFNPVMFNATARGFQGRVVPDFKISLIKTRFEMTSAEQYTADALFLEAKPIAANRNASNYCRSGLERFITGRYAWRMPVGMMLGYVRNNDEITEELVPALRTNASHWYQDFTRCPLTSRGPPVYITTHNRVGVTVGVGVDAEPAGDITVRHLWLSVTTPCENP